jgi:hypothetical protein
VVVLVAAEPEQSMPVQEQEAQEHRDKVLVVA